MENKQRFKFMLTYEDGTERKIWSGKCTKEEIDQKFNGAIKVQQSKYNVDHKGCQLCVYDETGRKIAQETFHGRC